MKQHLHRKNICNPILDDISIKHIGKYYNIQLTTKTTVYNQVKPVFEQVKPAFIQKSPINDNSFRTSTEGSNNNWDAVWIFLKYRVSDDILSAWSHGTLSSSGHTMPSGYTYDLPADYKGLFIYRSSAGIVK